ncbi:hypothetical protein C0989_009444, partial [Termitomyces sp. Mn162]
AHSIPTLPINPQNPIPLPIPTITNMNNNLTAQHARMPPHNDTTAPKWDKSHPRELPQYFNGLDYLVADCGITDDTQKKDYAACYFSYDTVETWLGLPKFGNNIIIGNNAPQPYTYQEWKAAVLRMYPGTDAMTLGRFSDYYQDFQHIARWLLANSKLYCNEEHHLLQQGIPTLLWSKIVCQLEITLPDHQPESPYDIDQVFEGAKWVLKGTDSSTTKTSNGTTSITSSPIANAPVLPSPTPKQETLKLVTTTAIVSALEHLEALLTNNNAQPHKQFTSSTCHFCGRGAVAQLAPLRPK